MPRSNGNRILSAAVAALTVGLIAATPASADVSSKTRVKAPKKGQFIDQTGERQEVTLYVAKRRIRRAELEFQCGFATAHTTIRRIKLKRTPRGYRFTARRSPAFSYNDGRRSQFGPITLTGRFTRGGKRVRGRVRMRTPRCGRSGRIPWSAAYTSPQVRTPKSGQYGGSTAQGRALTLYLSTEYIQLADIQFACGTATGRTSVSGIEMKRTRRGYSFSIRANGIVTYSDDRPDENAAVAISGRFAPGGRRAAGRLSASTPSCGRSGRVRWAVQRRSG